MDILAKPNDGIYITMNGTNALLEIGIPKNYPVTNIPLESRGGFYVFVNDNEIISDWKLGNCFYHFSIPVPINDDLTKVKILFSSRPSLDPYYALDVSSRCLPQTIENYEIKYEIKYEIWTNLRGESVLIFSSFVEKLLEYGYINANNEKT